MEIYTNSSWQKLCTSQWDEADLNLTCMAMGYYNNGVYANDTWYAERGNASKKSIYHNCTTPTTCQKNLAKKHQFCKGKNELYTCNIFVIPFSEFGNMINFKYIDREVKCLKKLVFRLRGLLRYTRGIKIENFTTTANNFAI